MSDTRPRFVKVLGVWICNQEEVERSIRPPPHDCPNCQTGHYTESQQHTYSHSYHHSISDTSAINIASTYVKELQERRKHITNCLSSHADLLMSRWRKRSQEERRELLHKAVPELEEWQWIYSRYGYSVESFRYGERTVQRRRQLLVPWLNVEVLKTSPAVLFALLHYRTLYPPEDFATLDCRQMELSWVHGYFDVEFSAKCVVMSGPRYGEIVDWDAQQAHSGYTLGYPRARLVLEAQAVLMDVLSRITNEILEGADTASASARTNKWRDLTSIGFRHPRETELWSPYTNPAFSRPPKLDMGYILSMAQTRKEEAIDHLIDLQCDPGYLRRQIKGYFKTMLSRAADTEEAAMMVAFHIYMDTHPGQPIPPKYDLALGALELLLANQVTERTTQIDHAMLFAMIDDHLAKNNRKETARIDESLLREMADISALHESLISLRLNRPLNTYRELKDVRRTEKRGLWKYLKNKPKEKPKEHSWQELKKLGKPLVDGFYKGKAPSGVKNKAWLQQSQTLRGFVEGFFKELENLFRKELEGNDLEAETIEEFLGEVLVQNKPEYLEAIAREEEEIMAKITKAEKPAPDTFLDRSRATEGFIRADLVETSHREKVKTRPDNSSSSSQSVDDPESPDIATLSIEPVTRLRVSPRTLGVVHLMYPDAQTKPRNITWDDFVYTLCDAGFVASNNGGSAVRFERGSGGDGGGKGAIIFHKPHPVLKIDPVMLHGMGRRLTKWFGWTRDSFAA
ncbi:ycfA-like protein domain-containing protein [Colletotrichum scovillei]|uniref:YcfA-like protein domain-containing protein n=1 Tax=Colletotrichum scovillei TaxID=1209932 RepID=A0A9P7UDA1_9PEZI|nr:ycfA-like protein domain-containing protein [Colletotrichum scovillei]KAG7045992.1 ycfA-like protein domain-containing protein [Colletotrichum scovillei]KAG7063306.1 ycfA-like protein domain-containing protein [Colletotrichum scovillei]